MNGYRCRVTELRLATTRVLRACALSAVAVTSALAAHHLSGGVTPTASTVVQAALVLTVVMGLLVRRRHSVTTLLLGLGGTQLLLHQWFSLASPGECASHLATQYLPGAHLLPQSVLPWGLLAQTARACATTGDTGATAIALALAGHAFAAALTGALVTRGEALLAALLDLGPRLPGVPDLPVHQRCALPRTATELPASPLLRHLQRRGPPLRCTA